MTGSADLGTAPAPERRADVAAPVVGLLTSIGGTLDAFFLEITERWREQGAVVESAAGSLAETFAEATVLPSITRRPSMPCTRS